jgi:hypothetical protein
VTAGVDFINIFGQKCKVAFKLQKKLELFAQKIFEDTAKAVRVQNFLNLKEAEMLQKKYQIV